MNLTVTSPGRAQNMERFLWPRSVQFVSFRVPDEGVTSPARSWIEAWRAIKMNQILGTAGLI